MHLKFECSITREKPVDKLVDGILDRVAIVLTDVFALALAASVPTAQVPPEPRQELRSRVRLAFSAGALYIRDEVSKRGWPEPNAVQRAAEDYTRPEVTRLPAFDILSIRLGFVAGSMYMREFATLAGEGDTVVWPPPDALAEMADRYAGGSFP